MWFLVKPMDFYPPLLGCGFLDSICSALVVFNCATCREKLIGVDVVGRPCRI